MTLLVAFHVGASIACNCDYDNVTRVNERIGDEYVNSRAWCCLERQAA